jgi:hypothetical protein
MKGMETMRSRTLLLATVLAIGGTSSLALAQGEKLYVLHSPASGGCPALDWHVTVASDGAMSGIVGWKDMEHLARVSGTANRQDHTLKMTATEIGGQSRTAEITGAIEGNGYLNVNIHGSGVNCTGVVVPYWLPPKGIVGGGSG